MKNIKNIAGGCVASLLLAGCFSLDQYPHDTIAVEDSFKTLVDARYWSNGMYEKLRGSTHGVYMNLSELQTDLIDIRQGNTGGKVYTWEEFTASEPATQSIWGEYYNSIANINVAIDGLETIKANGKEEIQKLNSYKGEMYLARALYYSKLVALFCKAYDPATADTDLGLPLLQQLLVNDLPERSSLKQTYDFILSDIAKAQNLLFDNEEVPNQPGSQRMTSDAAKLLKARVLLYRGDWKQAYETAVSLIQSGTYPLVNSIDALRQVWYDDKVQETLVQLFASKEEKVDANALNNLYTGEYVYSVNGQLFASYTPAYLPNQWVLDLYEDADIRKSTYYAQKEIRRGDSDLTKDLHLVYKFPGNPELRSGRSSKAEHAPKIFRIAEAYLIAAEAAYMDGNQLEAAGYLNALRTQRLATEITQTGMSLLQEIKNERVRELSFEGYRLMDLKRWKEGVDRSVKQPQDINFIVTNPAEQYHMLKKSADDFRMIWPIPSSEILRMGKDKLKQNSGW